MGSTKSKPIFTPEQEKSIMYGTKTIGKRKAIKTTSGKTLVKGMKKAQPIKFNLKDIYNI